MDKQFAFILIGFLAVCAGFITWAALGGPKKSVSCKWLAVSYAAFVWLCIITLVTITIIFK